MTIQELNNELGRYTDHNMEVKIAMGHHIRPINNIDTVIDMDTNAISIMLVAKELDKRR